MNRSIVAKSAAAALLGLALALVAVDPAAAAGELEVSTDGVTYGASIATPLFNGLDQLVPLDSRTASFWVRNAASTDAYLRVSVEDSTWSDPAFASTLTVGAAAPGHPGTALEVSSTAACRVLLFGVLLAPGEAVEVTITLALGDLNGSTGQTADVGIDLAVTLADAAGGSGGDCTTATPVPVVAPRTARPAPLPSATPTTPPDDGGSAGPSDDPPFVELTELLANTFAGFNSGVIGWSAGAALAGALAYVVIEVRAQRRGPIADPEIASTPQEDIS